MLEAANRRFVSTAPRIILVIRRGPSSPVLISQSTLPTESYQALYSNNQQQQQQQHRQQKMAQAEVAKETKPQPTEEEEFLIAADLTLYANPLRCLTMKPKTPGQQKPKPAPPKDKKDEEETDIIAADLTKYGSPLDDKN